MGLFRCRSRPTPWYRYCLRVEPAQVSHKIWLDGQAEPEDWTAIDVAPEGQFLCVSSKADRWPFGERVELLRTVWPACEQARIPSVRDHGSD